MSMAAIEILKRIEREGHSKVASFEDVHVIDDLNRLDLVDIERSSNEEATVKLTIAGAIFVAMQKRIDALEARLNSPRPKSY